jgi:hypothetical protein
MMEQVHQNSEFHLKTIIFIATTRPGFACVVAPVKELSECPPRPLLNIVFISPWLGKHPLPHLFLSYSSFLLRHVLLDVSGDQKKKHYVPFFFALSSRLFFACFFFFVNLQTARANSATNAPCFAHSVPYGREEHKCSTNGVSFFFALTDLYTVAVLDILFGGKAH